MCTSANKRKSLKYCSLQMVNQKTLRRENNEHDWLKHIHAYNAHFRL